MTRNYEWEPAHADYDGELSAFPLSKSLHWGFKSSIQSPWFMIWREYKVLNEVVYAEVLFRIGR